MILRSSRAMTSTIDLSLERVRKLAAKLSPYTRPTIHITGTNGKGSVASLVSSILHESGLKVGRFNSPHLTEVRDSISISQAAVSSELYLRSRMTIENINSARSTAQSEDNGQEINASLFEVLTVTALYIFEKEAVDIAVVEVGMGGRLDATNILPDEGVIIASAMTAVDLDHVKWLGSSISAIAQEKAGIVRRDAPLILGPQKWPEVENVVKEYVNKVGSTVRSGAAVSWKSPSSDRVQYPTHDRPYRPYNSVMYQVPKGSPAIELDLPLPGAHQLDNLSTALGIVENIQDSDQISGRITIETISRGVKNTRWPGRLEYILCTLDGSPPFTILADGAHNAASSAALRQYINTLNPKKSHIPFVIALSHSPPKTPLETLQPLLEDGDHVALVPFSPVVDMPWVTHEDTQQLLDVCKGLVGSHGEVYLPEGGSVAPQAVPQNLIAALKWTSQKSDLVVVAGSLYLVADLYRLVEMYPQWFKIL